MNIKLKLIITFLAIAVIPSLLIGYFSLSITENAILSFTNTPPELLGIIDSFRLSIVALITFILIVSVLIGLFLAHSISDPLTRLTRQAERISKGNLEIN